MILHHLIEIVGLGDAEILVFVRRSAGVGRSPHRGALQGSNERTDHLSQLHQFRAGMLFCLFGDDAGAGGNLSVNHTFSYRTLRHLQVVQELGSVA